MSKKRAPSSKPAEPELPLSERAHRAMLSKILGGELAPGEVITERQISIQLEISRTPLREAIRRLEGARLLERQKSGALVVRALPLDEFIHILGVRRALEGEAAALAAGHVSTTDIERLRRRAEAVMQVSDDVPVPIDGDLDIHAVVATAAANPVLEEMLAALRMRTSMFKFGRHATRRSAVVQEHLAVLDALEKGDAAAARRAMEQHIDNVKSTLIARLTGSVRGG